jgi:1,4-dihydroxy-6-naphthoate synthase
VARVPVRLGHSADPDDAFMFWALDAGRVDTRGIEFEQVVSDIQTLNEWATEGRLEVTAISLGAYPHVADRYVLLPHGASMGSGYGPVVVTREPVDVERLRGLEIVIPGRMTTAYLVLRFALGEDVPVRELPFDEILDEVASGRADAGLVIHEGQLTYRAAGLHKALDLGEWWLLETGLPLPLGVNVARRDLGERLEDVSAVLGAAIRCGLDNRDEAMDYARRFGRGIDAQTADRFVAMYVNELTCDYGDEGRKAVAELLSRGDAIGAFPEPVRLDYVP